MRRLNAGRTDRTHGTEGTDRGERGRPRWRTVLLSATCLGLACAAVLTALVATDGGSGGTEPRAGRPQAAGGTDTDVLAAGDGCGGNDPAHPEASEPAAENAGLAVREIQERGKLIVGIDVNSYLWGYRDPSSGRIMGFDIDLVQAIAASILGTDDPAVTYLAIPTNQREEAILEGTVDMVVRTMSITCTRRENGIDFSTAYFSTGQQMLVPAGSPVTGFDGTLQGRRVCVAAGSSAAGLFGVADEGAGIVDVPDGTAVEGTDFASEDLSALVVPNHLDCLVRLQLGEADALVTDQALALGHIAQDRGMRMVGQPLGREYYGVAMARGKNDLVGWVNSVLEEYRAGGSASDWRAAYDTWLADAVGQGTRRDGERAEVPDFPSTPPDPLYRE
ncbi:transporter substrate-binding domain-containing protein [Streptomyces sp. RFCAC02]|uniref:transporter substrate-binding domain-containing protein n=1 Tax=Streptomyces sp. RFCAC02 TaxID=2499143 RepID=UPI0010215714|nr:transporter substrate-binding domain-containing protein [Streptomyces sp. RFCAC02]